MSYYSENIKQGGKPSLLLPGKVIIKPWMTSAEKTFIETRPGIDYVIDTIQNFIPTKRGVQPKKPAKSPGERYLAFKSGTGSGKSTTLPPYLYKLFFEGLHKNIAMTEPRIFNCMNITDEIALYNTDLKIGENLGYSTGNFKKKINKGIIIMTVGVLLQQLKTLTDEEFMNRYFVIIIDEVHVRAVDNDLVMYYLKKLIERNYQNPDCPFVILTSGTFDEKLFMSYFDIPENHYIEVEGLSFPIEIRWPKEPVKDLVGTIISTVKEIHVSSEGIKDLKDPENKFRDVLIVVDSTALIDRLTFEIHKLNLEHDIESIGYIIPIGINSERFNAGGKSYQQLMSNVSSIKGHLMKPESASIKLGGYGRSSSMLTVNIQSIDSDSDKEDGVILPPKKHKFKNKKNKTMHIEANDNESVDGVAGGNGGRFMTAAELLDQIKWETKTVNFSRRVIIATNLIETGVTIETLKYCIDSGLQVGTEFNPLYNAGTLIMGNPITKGMALQRKGRTGRKSPGVWYPMYTEELFNSLINDQFPDIITKEITENLLSAIIQETGSVVDKYDKTLSFINKLGFSLSSLDVMGYPAADSLDYCLEKLFILGFITHTENIKPSISAVVPTKLGMFANKFRKLRLESIKMIMAGYYYKANILDLITIAIFLEANKWEDFSFSKLKSHKPRNPLGVSDMESDMYYKIFWADDFIECLWIWYDFMEVLDKINPTSKNKAGIGYAKKWCNDNRLNYEGLLMLIQNRDELIDLMINIGVNPFYNGLGLKRGSYNLKEILKKDLNFGMREISKIKSCIYEGYKLNTATFDKSRNQYVTDWKKQPIDTIDSKLIRVIPVSPQEKDVRQSQPNHIVVSRLMIMSNVRNRNIYSLVCNSPISVLDGFVDVDDGILYQW
jgi:HrpA-like RNA helicase